jgi:hypothetical protein
VPRRALSLAPVLLALAYAPAVAREPVEPLRPCKRADLVGFWEVIRFGFARDAVVDRDDPAYHMHQRFVFRPDATMAYHASATPLTLDDEQALRRAASQETWTLDPGGRLVRQRPGTPQVERSACQVVTRPLRDPRSPVRAQPGDVLLTDQTEDERPTVRRLLRKRRSGG